jgi:hypothetical protein
MVETDEAQGQTEISFCITRSDDEKYKRRFTLHALESKILIGRAPECDVQVSLVGISAAHATLHLGKRAETDENGKKQRSRGHELCIRDLSVNGTGLKYKDGTKVILKKDIDAVVPDGASLLLPRKGSKAARGLQEVPRTWLTVTFDSPLANGASIHSAGRERQRRKRSAAKVDEGLTAEKLERHQRAVGSRKKVDSSQLPAVSSTAAKPREVMPEVRKKMEQRVVEPVPDTRKEVDQRTVEPVPMPATPPGPPPPPEPGTRWTVWVDRSRSGKLGISINPSALLVERIAPASSWLT